MSSQLLLVSEVYTVPGAASRVARDWKKQPAPVQALERKVYEAVDGSSALELIALRELGDIAQLTQWWQKCWNAIGLNLHGDFKRQVLQFVEAPKDIDELLPASQFIQMRHVEVRPPAYDDYLAWRNRTIFNVVRKAEEVETFLAYHSLLSTEPGVMFVSGFSCDIDRYTKIFNSAEYQDIVRQAGDQFITGSGLYTKIYRHIDA